MTPTMSTTAYAVLGLLALRPMTPYELTQQMQRSLDYCWPTSERSLYDQPDRLVAAGYAEAVGAGERRRYAATESGRAALRRWLGEGSAMPKFQNEPLLRVLFADHGTIDDLRRVLGDLRSHVATRRIAGIAQLETYLAGDGMFPERTHIVTVVGDLIGRILGVLDDWAAEVEVQTANWTTTTESSTSEAIQSRLRAVVAREAERATHPNRPHPGAA